MDAENTPGWKGLRSSAAGSFLGGWDQDPTLQCGQMQGEPHSPHSDALPTTSHFQLCQTRPQFASGQFGETEAGRGAQLVCLPTEASYKGFKSCLCLLSAG